MNTAYGTPRASSIRAASSASGALPGADILEDTQVLLHPCLPELLARILQNSPYFLYA